MNQRNDSAGRYAFFSSSNNWEMGKRATFYDQQALTDSQLERALDPRSRAYPIVGPGVRERIRYYFFRTFVPFWIK